MAMTSKKVVAGEKIKAADHNTLVDDVISLDGKKTSWGDIANKPTTFPSAATKWGDIPDKPEKFPSDPTKWSDISGKPSTFDPKIGTTATTAKAGNYVPKWSDITNKPSTFPVEAQTWKSITGKPTTFVPATHTHKYADLEEKPTIPTVPSTMPTTEATTGTATTARTISAKVLNDLIDAKIETLKKD